MVFTSHKHSVTKREYDVYKSQQRNVLFALFSLSFWFSLTMLLFFA